MPRHPDAIGFLHDLAAAEGKPWFRMVCDLAIRGGASTLDKRELDVLVGMFVYRASYIGLRTGAVAAVAAAPCSAADFIESLSGFANFKLIDSSLQIAFKKRISIVFGANGSGKSSLCEALKILASPETPDRPLQNVRATGMLSPSFTYKLRSEPTATTWTPTAGYGSKRSIIKYFDAGIALKSVHTAIEPGQVVALTPFKLQVFETAKHMTAGFRDELRQLQERNAEALKTALEEIRRLFEAYGSRPLASIEETSLDGLAAEIELGESFHQSEVLKVKLAAAADMERATSEEGLRLLRAEHRDLESILSSLQALLDSAQHLWGLQPSAKTSKLKEKLAEQEALAKTLIPAGWTLDDLLSLLRMVSPLCSMASASGQECPLCRRALGGSEVELFKQYHGLLVGAVEKEIEALRSDLVEAADDLKAIRGVNRKEWRKLTTLPPALMAEVMAGTDRVIEGCSTESDPSEEAIRAYGTLKELIAKTVQQLENKKQAIETASAGREQLLERLKVLIAELEPMKYAQQVAANLTKLREVHNMAEEAARWDSSLTVFTPLLKKITTTAKEAHDDLVVADFETRLNAEYYALSNRQMPSFGVKLQKKGSEGAVTVSPQVGGKEIAVILSEGEQRVHALALFFAELESSTQSILVFDDPISSFDYNYTANFCTRLRDFVQAHPATQIIVLTHNWEFFMRIQSTCNRDGLNGQHSVQIIENCAIVADYSEKTDKLKADISAILSLPGEPGRDQKELLAGKMRRLIEAVVNTHVFNNQRHQYKQKNQPVSDFPEFTKLVPLLPSEATSLRDLYTELSIPEHDDPRNAYVNTDKATFEARYDGILAVESAIVARK